MSGKMDTDLGLILEGPVEQVEYRFAPDEPLDLTRRGFVQVLGAGVVIAVGAPAVGQERRGGGGGGRGGGGGGPRNLSARIHIGEDGTITVMTGKVEAGQGARAQITQAAAEELRVSPEQVRLVMADTALVPNDGITAGSRTTPSTLPSIRQGAAAARDLLAQAAAKRWGVQVGDVTVKDGKAVRGGGDQQLTYAELAKTDEAVKAFAESAPADVSVTAVNEWRVMGTSVARPNRRDLVTGAHQFPSDIRRPGMLYGKVLRPASYGAKLTKVDAAATRGVKDAVVVEDIGFVGVAAPTTFSAEQALGALAKSAAWEAAPHPSSKELYRHLRETARGGIPKNAFAEELEAAAKRLKQTFHVAYVQHAPMEPRAAVAEWADGKLTVWTATQNPFSVRGELQRAFGIPEDRVRVIVPDFGGGFGGKHTGECAVEAARLAKGANRPVSLRWTREEEFTWAAFRPAAVIDAEATLDGKGMLTSWYFVNVNSGGSSIEPPYRVGKAKTQFVQADAPLRHGSYRALAATANTFAREVFLDELAEAAGSDPLSFRLAHVENPRLRAVLETAAEKFWWRERFAKKSANVGVGLACGTEKASFVAACVEVGIDREKGRIVVRHVCQAYECGKITTPDNLLSQVQGAIIQGLGPALGEEMQFEGGRMLNAGFRKYPAPRFSDVPKLDIHLLDRPDLPSVGAGETPIIAVAPAIANAVRHATGIRIHEMPIRLPTTA